MGMGVEITFAETWSKLEKGAEWQKCPNWSRSLHQSFAIAVRLNFALNRKVWGLDLFELDFAFSNIKNTAFLTWNFGFPQVVAQEVGGSRQSATAKVKN